MAVKKSSAPPVRFGVFEADLTTGELRRNGRTLKLQPQPFRVLAILMARPGELVTRDEIHQTLWGEDTFVDRERGLNFAMNKIGDDPERPRRNRSSRAFEALVLCNADDRQMSAFLCGVSDTGPCNISGCALLLTVVATGLHALTFESIPWSRFVPRRGLLLRRITPLSGRNRFSSGTRSSQPSETHATAPKR